MTSNPATPNAPSPDEAPATSLTARTASGFAWLAGRTIATKALAFVTQIALAYLLVREDFGLVGLAYTFAAFANLVSQAGLRQVLIQQHDRFAERMRPAFWLSVAAGAVGAMLIVAFTPIAVAIYHEPKLTPVMLVLALAPIVESVGIVPRARIDAEMRFGYLAGVEIAVAVAQAALSITLAALGFGALSVIIPRPIVSSLRTAALWTGARIGWPGGPTTRGWRSLLGGSLAMLGATFAFTTMLQGDYLLLGLMYDTAIVGLYYFAFNLAMQAATLLIVNLQFVLLPALSQIKDEPRRQAQAMVRSSTALSLIATPISVWLACAGDPLIRLVFHARWADAAPIFSILALAMISRTISAPASNLMQAQGRFGACMWTHFVAAMLFFPIVGIGAWIGQGAGAALGVLAHGWLYAWIANWRALAPTRVPVGSSMRAMLAPIAAAIPAFLPMYILSVALPRGGMIGDALRVGLLLLIGGVVYIAIVRIWSRRAVRECLEQIAARLPQPLANRLLAWR